MNTTKADFNFYNELGTKYPETSVVYKSYCGKMRLLFFSKLLPRLTGSLLDLGCNNYVYEGFWNGFYVGVDIARAPLLQGNRSGIQADACLLPFKDNCFNYILLCEMIEHLGVPGKSRQTRLLRVLALREARRVLTDTGQAFLTVPSGGRGGPDRVVWMKELNKWKISYHPYVHGDFYLKDLTALVTRGGFKVVEHKYLCPKADLHLYVRLVKDG